MSRPKQPRVEKLTCHFNIPRDIVELFDKAYPSCRTRFVVNAMRVATADRDTFEKIFFYDLLKANGHLDYIDV